MWLGGSDQEYLLIELLWRMQKNYLWLKILNQDSYHRKQALSIKSAFFKGLSIC